MFGATAGGWQLFRKERSTKSSQADDSAITASFSSASMARGVL